METDSQRICIIIVSANIVVYEWFWKKWQCKSILDRYVCVLFGGHFSKSKDVEIFSFDDIDDIIQS